ncbi:MAG: hypothetical protein WBF77_07560 [Sulfurimonadaceae bacterium]
MYKTDLSQIQTFLLLFITLIIVSGCAKNEEKLQVEPTAVPEITTAYLLEHRIISYQPMYREKIIATLPYEIKTFDEGYLLYLIARIPDKNSSVLLKTKKPRYYLWLERRADNWRDFVAVFSAKIKPLKINAHYSTIRQGHYYKEYTIDFTLEQLSSVQDSGLDLLLVNQQNLTSTINIPSPYIKAYLEMIAQTFE